jgi:hypothetical protein
MGESEKLVEMLSCCQECGCTDVECAAWINVNTDKISSSGSEGPVDYFWCPRCDMEVNRLCYVNPETKFCENCEEVHIALEIGPYVEEDRK